VRTQGNGEHKPNGEHWYGEYGYGEHKANGE
jgi:hypothetical protein